MDKLEKILFVCGCLFPVWFIIAIIGVDSVKYLNQSLLVALLYFLVALNVKLHRMAGSQRRKSWHSAWAYAYFALGVVLWHAYTDRAVDQSMWTFTNGLLFMVPAVVWVAAYLIPLKTRLVSSAMMATTVLMIIKALTVHGPYLLGNKLIEINSVFYNCAFGFGLNGLHYAFSNWWAVAGITALFLILFRYKKNQTGSVQPNVPPRVPERKEITTTTIEKQPPKKKPGGERINGL
jgi:hypothetical protein